MELEAVGRVSMSNLRLKVCGQIDNVDRAERAFLYTDTTANTQAF